MPQVAVTLTAKHVVHLQMIVDSGAAEVTLTESTARALGLRPSKHDRAIKLVSADGRITVVHLMQLKSVQLGQFTVNNVECAVQPRSVKHADNLLGGTFLRHFEYRMDLAAGVLHLMPIPQLNTPSANGGAGGTRGETAPPASEIQIVSAKWSGHGLVADVTARVKELVAQGDEFKADYRTLQSDPAPKWKKKLTIIYRKDGSLKTAVFRARQLVHLSAL